MSKLLFDLYNIHSPSGHEDKMIQFIKDKLTSMKLKPKVDRWGNVYVIKGNGPQYPTMVAHMDK